MSGRAGGEGGIGKERRISVSAVHKGWALTGLCGMSLCTDPRNRAVCEQGDASEGAEKGGVVNSADGESERAESLEVRGAGDGGVGITEKRRWREPEMAGVRIMGVGDMKKSD